ncbi:MAG: restriction endonuclease [Microcoleaceae cyanobacterium]
MEHSFTAAIKQVLREEFDDNAENIYVSSPLFQYINIKTKSANRGSKARSSFGNLYAIYVLIEDYLQKGFNKIGSYRDYEGAKFSDLFRRQRELPFGQSLQNHALNHRCNEEFKKYFPTCDYIPIVRVVETSRYWFNENLLIVQIDNETYNISSSIIKIIDEYIKTKQSNFENFIEDFQKIKALPETEKGEAIEFIINLLAPNVDARLFEIVSYCILKYYYHDLRIFWGFDLENIQEENLTLYKTGRTNANDGGIDFVMKPLGRFFQVTETVDVKKYFLDIDKIEHYPITFVIKSQDSVETILNKIREKAIAQYPVTAIVNRYLNAIEEIINIPILINRFQEAINQDYLGDILEELIKQSQVEFNYTL